MTASPGAAAGTPELDRDRLCRVALTQAREPADLWLTTTVVEHGAASTYEGLLGGRRLDPRLEETASRLRTVDPARELSRGRRLGLRYVVPGDAEWPEQLADLHRVEVVEDMGGVPLGLWVRGPQRLDRLEQSVAIVGARSATTYGCEIAAEIAAGVARTGAVVISGGAVGIDVAAHRGALAGDAPSVAVLACGADRAYPVAHTELLDHLGEVGAVVSEAPPGSAPHRHRFLTRNRIIAALARGTVVVEAAVRSGALNTASWSDALLRPLMGVPGPVTSATSEGVHELIRSGRATLVTDSADVLEVVAPMGEHLLSPRRAPSRRHDHLTGSARRVLDAVPVLHAAPPDSIARVASLDVAEVTDALALLEREGLVERDAGGWSLARHREGASPGT